MPIVADNTEPKRRRPPLWALLPAVLSVLTVLIVWSFFKPLHISLGSHELLCFGAWEGGRFFTGFNSGPQGSWDLGMAIPGTSAVFSISCYSRGH